ncbi:MAG: hypothetical protein ABIP34_20770 [Rhodoferax sp.]|uniref:hypothetical protein n=1 Tax=Rhodoferax sp. TaxID=50421 RepID=UPI003263E21F
MFNTKAVEPTNNLADQAADTATDAIKTTQRAANSTLDSLNSTVQDLRRQAAPLLNRAAESANAYLQQGLDAVHDGSDKVRTQARNASARTVNYIKDEPVKSILIAAAAGAVLTALVQIASRSRDDR